MLPPEPVTCVSWGPDPPEVLVTVYERSDPETPTLSPTEIPWFVWVISWSVHLLGGNEYMILAEGKEIKGGNCLILHAMEGGW
jgi:hypothetical protein